MPITVYTGEIPNRRMTPEDFNESFQDLLDYIPEFVAGTNSTEGIISGIEATTLAARTEAVNAASAAAVTTGAYGTSVTSLAIGVGSKNFTTQTGKTFVVGMKVLAAAAADPAGKYMYGTVMSYNSGSGALTLYVTETYGSGSFADWSLTITGPTSAEIGSWVISVVANSSVLGIGTAYGESKVAADTGRRWVWVSPGVWFENDKPGVIPGSIIMWPTEVVPAEYLECDGTAISRITYANLFAAIGTRYGVGDGSTTFNVPDYRGEFPRGWAHGSTKDPDRATRTNRGDGTTGDAVGTKQPDAFKLHNHTFTHHAGAAQAAHAAGEPYTGSYSYTGNAGGNETRPTNINVMFCIKF